MTRSEELRKRLANLRGYIKAGEPLPDHALDTVEEAMALLSATERPEPDAPNPALQPAIDAGWFEYDTMPYWLAEIRHTAAQIAAKRSPDSWAGIFDANYHANGLTRAVYRLQRLLATERPEEGREADASIGTPDWFRRFDTDTLASFSEVLDSILNEERGLPCAECHYGKQRLWRAWVAGATEEASGFDIDQLEHMEAFDRWRAAPKSEPNVSAMSEPYCTECTAAPLERWEVERGTCDRCSATPPAPEPAEPNDPHGCSVATRFRDGRALVLWCVVHDRPFNECDPNLEAEPEPAVVEERCERSGNPVGTDTWGNGAECPCGPCQRWLRARRPEASPGEGEHG